MKYTIKEHVWKDKITEQTYTKDYAFRPVVAFDANGIAIKGYVYSPYNWVAGVTFSEKFDDVKQFGYSVYCMGQKLFLTDAQVAERFEYLGKLERHEDIDEQIKYYSEEECNFENLEWLAKHTVRDLAHKNAGGLTQCINAKLLEFLFKNAPQTPEMEEIKKMYFNSDVEKKDAV